MWEFLIFFPLYAFITYIIDKEEKMKITEAKRFIKHCASILENHTEDPEINLLHENMVNFAKPKNNKQVKSSPGLKDLLSRNGIEPTGNKDEDMKLAKPLMRTNLSKQK